MIQVWPLLLALPLFTQMQAQPHLWPEAPLLSPPCPGLLSNKHKALSPPLLG